MPENLASKNAQHVPSVFCYLSPLTEFIEADLLEICAACKTLHNVGLALMVIANQVFHSTGFVGLKDGVVSICYRKIDFRLATFPAGNAWQLFFCCPHICKSSDIWQSVPVGWK